MMFKYRWVCIFDLHHLLTDICIHESGLNLDAGELPGTM